VQKNAQRRVDRPWAVQRGLLLVRSVGWIVGGFDFREAPHAGSVDLGDGVLERLAFDIFLDRPVLDLPLQADELPLKKRLGEVGEISPGVDAVPFSAGSPLRGGGSCRVLTKSPHFHRARRYYRLSI